MHYASVRRKKKTLCRFSGWRVHKIQDKRLLAWELEKSNNKVIISLHVKSKDGLVLHWFHPPDTWTNLITFGIPKPLIYSIPIALYLNRVIGLISNQNHFLWLYSLFPNLGGSMRIREEELSASSGKLWTCYKLRRNCTQHFNLSTLLPADLPTKNEHNIRSLLTATIY